MSATAKFGKFHRREKPRLTFFSRKKKKLSVRHLQNDRFGDFETEPETLFENRKYFFQRI